MSLLPLSIGLRKFITCGSLQLVGPTGESSLFGTPGAQPFVRVRITRPALLWQLFVRPSLYLGEAYMEGTLKIEQGTVMDLLRVLFVSAATQHRPTAWTNVVRRLAGAVNIGGMLNAPWRARRNVAHHYDLSPELYELFLDADRQYSCAYFRSRHDTLDEAQLYKKQHIASKLLLRSGLRVLDIGSGWGGLAIYLAQRFDVEVVGLTLSTEQYQVANQRAAELGLSPRVTFKLLDYRQEDQRYDRIVSVGMFEHVGRPYYRQFFAKLQDLLEEDGVALLHTIGRQAPPSPTNVWLRRYIFPGGYLPSLSQLVPILESRGLWLTDLEILRLHYAETLKAWNARFQKNRERVARLYDERFCRMWEFYLQCAEATFRYRRTTVFQMQLAKHVASVPITRDYMYDVEWRLRRQDEGECGIAPTVRR